MPPRDIAVRCHSALILIAAAGCGGSDLTLPNESVAANITIVKGDHQSAAIGSALADSLVVRVTDSRNQPVANQPLTFAVVTGGGSVSPSSTTTNSDGTAQTRWVLGPTAGAQQATAKATGNGAPADLSVAFNATATASAPAKIEAVAGNNQTSPAGSSVPTDPTVKVTDSRGNPVVGASVTFLVTAGGGAVNPTDPVPTNTSGLASVSWTLGPQAGQNTLSASVGGSSVAGNPVTFTATGTPGSAGKLVIITQPPVTAQSGLALSPAPAVQLQDLNGNNVKQGGVAILADIASGPAGASISGISATTNNKGVATFSNLVLTGPAGQYTISFSGTNLTGAISTPITLAAGGATKLAVLVPPSATAVSGAPFAQQPQVQLEDAAGNPVAQSGVSVLVTISNQPTGGGSLGGSTTVQTGADGVARFAGLSITGAAGQYTLLFASGNLTSVTAVVTIGAGSVSGSQSTFTVGPGTITASNGSSTATVTITARDGAGNPVQGAAASVAVSGSNTVSTPAPTGADGKTTATVSSTEAGTKTVTVTINGTPVTNPSSAPLVVSPGAPSNTTSTTVPAPTSPVVGQTALITVTVKDAFGNPIPGRSVSLSSGGGAQITQPSSPTNSAGVTTGAVTYSTAGNKGLTATISGDGSLAPITITVAKGATTISLQTNPNPSNVGEQVTLTATVTVTAPAAGAPTGSVRFFDNGVLLDSDNLNGSSIATVQHTFLIAGDHPLTAQYVGDANFIGSTSATVTQHVNIVNQAPTANDDAYSTNQDVPLSVDAPGVLANDSDPNNDSLSAALDTGPSSGGLTLNPDGSFTYTPNSGFSGQDSFTYHATDGSLSSNSATVTITVNPSSP
jgi:adhesin/invasin